MPVVDNHARLETFTNHARLETFYLIFADIDPIKVKTIASRGEVKLSPLIATAICPFCWEKIVFFQVLLQLFSGLEMNFAIFYF